MPVAVAQATAVASMDRDRLLLQRAATEAQPSMPPRAGRAGHPALRAGPVHKVRVAAAAVTPLEAATEAPARIFVQHATADRRSGPVVAVAVLALRQETAETAVIMERPAVATVSVAEHLATAPLVLSS